MSVENVCSKCDAEYDSRHGKCPACGYKEKRRAQKAGGSSLERMVRRLGWKPINKKRLPKTGFVVAGSYRDGVWTTSSVSHGNGFPPWADADRTHYFQIPKPPNAPDQRPAD